MKAQSYHTIVIWAGSGGLTVALGLASAGKNLLLIEKWYLWWDCTNFGCVPSKALIHGSDDMKNALSESRNIRDAFRKDESKEVFEAKYPKLTIVNWSAVFIDSHTLAIENKKYTAKNIVIATGSNPRLMTLEWIPSEKILSNRTIFEQEDIEKLVIVGGGFIGIEIALAFARRWVEVHILIRSDRLGAGIDDDFTLAMKSLLGELWVKTYYNTTIIRGVWDTVLVSHEGKEETISYSHILLALGRVPNTEWLGLENIWIQTDKGSIITDVYGRTNLKHIYALGDVVSWNRQFTHLANHEGRGIIQSLLIPFWKKKIKPVNIPSVLYDKEIEFARTWLTAEEAKIEYGEDAIIIDRMDFSVNDRSRTEKDEKGYVKIITKRLSLQILWAEIVWKNAWEMIGFLSIALENHISLYKLKNTIISYPTRMDLIKRLADRMVITTFRSMRSEIIWYIKKRIPVIFWLLLWWSIIAGFLYYKNHSGKDNTMILQDTYHNLSSTALWPLLYIVFYMIRPIIFFPATLLTFLSGTLFGVWWGFLYTMIGENLSASVAYFIGRFFWTHIPELKKTPISLNPNKTFSSILFTRLAFFPFDLVNYLAGFLRLSWLPFAIATVIGIIPWALVFIIAWASIQWTEDFDISSITFEPRLIIISIVLFMVSVVLAHFLKRKH